MKQQAFGAAAKAANLSPTGKTYTGCELVLVHGLSQAEAARRLEVSKATLSKALRKFHNANPCPCCGRVSA